MPEESLNSQEKLETFVYHWSVANNENPVRMSDFAQVNFSNIHEYPISKSSMDTYLRHFTNTRKVKESALEENASLTLQTALKWDLELVKHLGLTATAGLAGNIALLSQAQNNNPFTTLSLFSFIIALICAILCFYFISQALVKLGIRLQEKAKQIKMASSWEALEDATFSSLSRTENTYFKAGEIAGYTSATCSFFGLLLIIFSLLAV